MGLCDIFKKRKTQTAAEKSIKENQITIEQLIQEKYKQKYFKECKYIWSNYVPKSGQSDVLQGELLREIEKLRDQAQRNGNINWDDDFVYFCEFIQETLCSQKIYSEKEKTRITLVLNYIKECGNYAREFYDGKIPDDKVVVDMIAYTYDNLYNIVSDAIGLLQTKNPEPIPYIMNDKIKR